MIKHASLFTLFILSVCTSLAQEDCDGARYRYLVFDDFEKIEDVVYGSNIAASGWEVDLDMDVYMPVGDTATNRPVIVIAHGGFF